MSHSAGNRHSLGKLGSLEGDEEALLAELTPAGASIQFEDLGIDFSSWLKDFVARVKSNWIIAYSAMRKSGVVRVNSYVNKSGAIDQVSVSIPSKTEAFNKAAWQAVVNASPVAPLPSNYPSERCRFTIAFYYRPSR